MLMDTKMMEFGCSADPSPTAEGKEDVYEQSLKTRRCHPASKYAGSCATACLQALPQLRRVGTFPNYVRRAGNEKLEGAD